MLDFTRFDALTFDCFGTLIDWEAGILACVRRVLAPARASDGEILSAYAELEAEHERGGPRGHLPYREVLARVLEGLASRFGQELAPERRGALAESVRDWPAFADTPGALRALAGRFRLCVVSNVDDDLFAAVAPRLGVAFDAVVTAERCGSYKPAPGHFLAALRALDLPAGRVLHVAQSLYHDIAPARALGFTTVWVNRRHGRAGHGATPTPPAGVAPDAEVPDLATLARRAGAGARG